MDMPAKTIHVYQLLLCHVTLRGRKAIGYQRCDMFSRKLVYVALAQLCIFLQPRFGERCSEYHILLSLKRLFGILHVTVGASSL
jgi:hypothetical protein